MINLMLGPISDWLSKVGDILIYGLIAIIVIACIVIMAKYEATRKFLVYAIAVIIIAVGAYSSFGLYDELTTTSYINGSFENLNKQTETSLDYSTSVMLFKQDEEDSTKYIFSKDLNSVEDFDASKNIYEVSFNDYNLLNHVTYTAGSIYIEIPLEFMDTDGEISNNLTVHISIKFLSNNTSLEVWTFSEEDMSYLTQYVSDFGFRLQVEKI